MSKARTARNVALATLYTLAWLTASFLVGAAAATASTPPPLVTWDLCERYSFDEARDLAARGWEPYAVVWMPSRGDMAYHLRRRRS